MATSATLAEAERGHRFKARFSGKNRGKGVRDGGMRAGAAWWSRAGRQLSAAATGQLRPGLAARPGGWFSAPRRRV